MAARVLAAAVAAVLSLGTAEAREAGTPTAALADRAALAAFIDETMAQALASEHIAGAAVAVVMAGEVIFANGYGDADREKATPVDPARTVFRLGSIAKPVVGTAVMQLVEQGVLDLDADVNGYLEAFRIPQTFAAPVTLRHLLTHTAGFEERVVGDDRHRPPDQLRPLAQALPDLMPARVRPPGQIASYSNWSAALAGHVVELVSGQPFAAYVERNIFAPLGMTRSTFREPLPAPLAGDLAVGYHHEDGAFVAQDFEFLSDLGPAGALSGTVEDMARFMIAHLQGGRLGDARILGADTAARMQRRQFASHPRLAGMAISFGEATLGGHRILQHSGGTAAFHTNMALWPDHGVGLFAAFNGRGEAGDSVLRAFLERYFPDPEPPGLAPPAGFDARSARYTGFYRGNRLSFTRLEKAMYIGEATVHDTGRGTLFLGDLLSDIDNAQEGVELIEVGPDLFQAADGSFLVAFSGDASGEAANLFVGSSVGSFHRIAWYETVHVLVGVAALAFIVFVVTGGRRLWRLLRRHRPSPADRRRWTRAARGVQLALCAAGTVFIVGFPLVVLSFHDSFEYPPGIEVLLLPVAAVALTALAAGFMLLAWIGRQGTPWARIADTTVVLTAAVFLWFLDLWNILGWKL